MDDREQFMLRQAAKFDGMVKDELGMSANEALKAFSQGRLKGNNQQLRQAHRQGWEQCKAECEAIALDYEQKVYDSVGDPRVGNFTGRIARLIATMTYKEGEDEQL